MSEKYIIISTSWVTQAVKNLPAIWETWVWSQVGKIPWRREWWPTPVFLPGKFHGQRSLVGYSSWGHKELNTSEWLTLNFSFIISTDAEKEFNKVCVCFTVKQNKITISKLGIEGSYLNMIKTIQDKSRTNSLLSGRKL